MPWYKLGVGIRWASLCTFLITLLVIKVYRDEWSISIDQLAFFTRPNSSHSLQYTPSSSIGLSITRYRAISSSLDALTRCTAWSNFIQISWNKSNPSGPRAYCNQRLLSKLLYIGLRYRIGNAQATNACQFIKRRLLSHWSSRWKLVLNSTCKTSLL